MAGNWQVCNVVIDGRSGVSVSIPVALGKCGGCVFCRVNWKPTSVTASGSAAAYLRTCPRAWWVLSLYRAERNAMFRRAGCVLVPNPDRLSPTGQSAGYIWNSQQAEQSPIASYTDCAGAASLQAPVPTSCGAGCIAQWRLAARTTTGQYVDYTAIPSAQARSPTASYADCTVPSASSSHPIGIGRALTDSLLPQHLALC